MVGIILTGHAHFATGLTSSLELIAGAQENYQAVDFKSTDSSDDLVANLKQAVANLADCDKILVFSDLIGGSPFKLAVELKYELAAEKEIEVLAGTNLGMLIETCMMAKFNDDLGSLVDSALNAGRQQVFKFELPAAKAEPKDTEEDGI